MNRPVKMGILGGMGPMATSVLYGRIVAHTKASKDQEHIDMVILSRASLPDRTAVIKSGDASAYVEPAVEDCLMLEQMGVQYIAVPCNTAHYFHEAVQARIHAKLLHMVRETVRTSGVQTGGKLGIMATDGTVSADVYGRECRAYGIEPVYPSEQGQKDVMHLIYDEIKQGKRGDEALFRQVTDELRQKGCEKIVLACTELSYFKEWYELPDDIIDSVDVLVRLFIETSGHEYTE